MVLDIALIVLTIVAIISKQLALKGVDRVLAAIDAPEDVRIVARRDSALEPAAPPGASHPVKASDIRDVATASIRRARRLPPPAEAGTSLLRRRPSGRRRSSFQMILWRRDAWTTISA
jgi:hypothetical protein